MGHGKRIGRPMSIPDGQIAAIVKLQGARLATRNIKDFESSGIDLINPFEN
jgi:predicted nucleic acid-binding protein